MRNPVWHLKFALTFEFQTEILLDVGSVSSPNVYLLRRAGSLWPPCTAVGLCQASQSFGHIGDYGPRKKNSKNRLLGRSSNPLLIMKREENVTARTHGRTHGKLISEVGLKKAHI
jgi:hypothetical protein